jgi:hypothetical protein
MQRPPASPTTATRSVPLPVARALASALLFGGGLEFGAHLHPKDFVR